MRNFLNFINKNHKNTYVKSALAHLWFVIIHPYEGGNGRMARALAHYCLASESIELFSISSIIYANKKDYYEILEQTTKLENNLNFDFTAWIKWHLEAVNRRHKTSYKLIRKIKFLSNLRAKALKFYLYLGFLRAAL